MSASRKKKGRPRKSNPKTLDEEDEGPSIILNPSPKRTLSPLKITVNDQEFDPEEILSMKEEDISVKEEVKEKEKDDFEPIEIKIQSKESTDEQFSASLHEEKPKRFFKPHHRINTSPIGGKLISPDRRVVTAESEKDEDEFVTKKVRWEDEEEFNFKEEIERRNQRLEEEQREEEEKKQREEEEKKQREEVERKQNEEDERKQREEERKEEERRQREEEKRKLEEEQRRQREEEERREEERREEERREEERREEEKRLRKEEERREEEKRRREDEERKQREEKRRKEEERREEEERKKREEEGRREEEKRRREDEERRQREDEERRQKEEEMRRREEERREEEKRQMEEEERREEERRRREEEERKRGEDDKTEEIRRKVDLELEALYEKIKERDKVLKILEQQNLRIKELTNSKMPPPIDKKEEEPQKYPDFSYDKENFSNENKKEEEKEEKPIIYRRVLNEIPSEPNTPPLPYSTTWKRPLYHLMNHRQKQAYYADFAIKYKLLNRQLPHDMQIPMFIPGEDLNVIHDRYERYLYQILGHDEASGYYFIVILIFQGIEMLGTWLGIPCSGFTMYMAKKKNKIRNLLIQMGEQKYLVFSASWPVPIQLLWIVLSSLAAFIVYGLIGKKLGLQAMKAAQEIGDYVMEMGSNKQIVNENGIPTIKEGDPQFGDGAINQFTSLLEGASGGNILNSVLGLFQNNNAKQETNTNIPKQDTYDIDEVRRKRREENPVYV